MSARVAGVYVHDPVTGAPVFYGPDDEVPTEHRSLIGDHVWSGGANPYVEQGSPQSVPAEGGGGQPVERPAKDATRGEWDAYAADTYGIDTESLPNKDAVVAAVDKAEAERA